MESAFFWIAWGCISFWVLRSYYFSYDKNKLQKLRKAAFGTDLSVLILFFLPWIPRTDGGQTGWDLISGGNISVLFLGILIAFSTYSFLTTNTLLLKTGTASHLGASILFILTMIRLLPGTYSLTFESIAPIVASLLLLAGNVVVLLVWQQLDLKKKTVKRRRR